jgi:hypothetical protein
VQRPTNCRERVFRSVGSDDDSPGCLSAHDLQPSRFATRAQRMNVILCEDKCRNAKWQGCTARCAGV